MSWVERVTLPRWLADADRYRLHQVVARAAEDSRAGRVLWAVVPGGLAIRTGDGRVRWDRGVERVSVDADPVVSVGDTLVIRGLVCAARRAHSTGHVSPVPEEELPEWVERQADRSGLGDTIIRSVSGGWFSALRARDRVRLTWHAYEIEFTGVVRSAEAWVVGRLGGWGKAKGFGFGLLFDSPLDTALPERVVLGQLGERAATHPNPRSSK